MGQLREESGLGRTLRMQADMRRCTDLSPPHLRMFTSSSRALKRLRTLSPSASHPTQRSVLRCTNTHGLLSACVFLQPLRTMKNECSGSVCGQGSDKGLSDAGSTRSMATSSWPPTFGSPPTAPTAEISSGKFLDPKPLIIASLW